MMTLDEIERVVASIEELAAALRQHPDSENTKALRNAAHRLSSQLRGADGFGDITEQLARVGDAASRYLRRVKSGDIQVAESDLSGAIARMRGVIRSRRRRQ
jgi:hypothetical protein